MSVIARSLDSLIDDLPQLPADTDFGPDIDRANLILLSDADRAEKRAAFWKWCARFTPCLFGRLSSHADKGIAPSKGLTAYLLWLDDADLALGATHVSAEIQRGRREFKDLAERGEASGFLIMINSARLAYAAPGQELIDVCVELSNLYLTEHAPIQQDVIYTEAVPLRTAEGQLTLFKAGCNIFYGGAHRTRNHDRRVPGGLLFSMNSPGHYAQSMHLRGLMPKLEDAIEFVRDTAYRSIGNGGLGVDGVASQSWHNRLAEGKCPVQHDGKLPGYVPKDFDPARYSALYHTDVLVPTDATRDGRDVTGVAYEETDLEIWSHLILDYITDQRFPQDHLNYGLFHGHPTEDSNKYHNPWPARRAHNTELFEY
ncbi:hypothetical protein [Hamadaea tsunoensis]|uniref:hypothetical protein n=1 Tax=Hamadaea tsunoensis TaxID=53368 RepID=UPI0004021571|nr:hypothetical protein [Hamadaea tsunoensis]